MDKDDLLLLAYGIAEYNTALLHLLALQSVGVAVPYVVIGRVEDEAEQLMRLWWSTTHGDPTWENDRANTVVIEARAWCTEHIDELDALLESRRSKETL
jgi:hypothetical protein